MWCSRTAAPSYWLLAPSERRTGQKKGPLSSWLLALGYWLLALCYGAQGQTVVNACGNSTGTSSASTISVTLASAGGTSGCTTNVSANDLLLVSCGCDSGGTINTPSDTQGNTFTAPSGASISGSGGAGNAQTFSAIAKSSGSDTITCNISTTAKNPHIDAREVSGMATNNTFDQSGTAQSTSTTPSVSTSGATTQNNEFVYGFIQDSPNSRTITVGSGYSNFVLANDTTGGDSSAGESKNVTSTGTQTAGFGGTSGDAVVMVITTWKAAGGTTKNCTLAMMGAGEC